MVTFTPEDVVAAYQSKGLKAAFNMYLMVIDGKYVRARSTGCCCALGVLGEGLDAHDGLPAMCDVGQKLGLSSPYAFCSGVDDTDAYDGFDGGFGEVYGGHPDYILGRACREACIAAGLWYRP